MSLSCQVVNGCRMFPQVCAIAVFEDGSRLEIANLLSSAVKPVPPLCDRGVGSCE